MPPIPALHASHAGTWLRSGQEEAPSGASTRGVSKGEAIMAAADTPLLILNAPLVATRLGYPDLSGLDLLELFAFVHPARFCVPTPKGLADALGLPRPPSDDAVPALLQQAARTLLAHCQGAEWSEREGAWSSLQSLAKMRWPWAQFLRTVIAQPPRAERWLFSALPEWEESADQHQPAQVTLGQIEIEGELNRLTGANAERRQGQHDYAQSAAHIFSPRERKRQPNVVLAQAGTGIGKTLGYLAPASLWAKKAQGTVWVSTFTKNLQRQLRGESARAWPEQRSDKTAPVVVRKGRENYLCLLNLEDAIQGGFGGRAAILAQLVARWASYTRDGDMIGGDLPGWLGTLFRRRAVSSLTDQRGECIYAGCPHYRKCFIERSARASAQADLVIANHALVMINAARGRDHAQRPSRIIFDEGHHVFQAADSVFAATLSGQESIEMRRWILGPERNAKGRRRGLEARLADIASYDEEGASAIFNALEAAQALPGEGWLQRILDGEASGPIERLLAAVRALTYARDESTNGSKGQEAGYGIETEAAQLPGDFAELAGIGEAALTAIRDPLVKLGLRLEAILAEAPDWLDSSGRARIEGARHSLAWRVELLNAWAALLARLCGPLDHEFVDWLAVDRSEGREYDVGIHRRWLDPMKPFAKIVLEPSHGIMLTSATLRDGDDWHSAITSSGAAHLPLQPRLFAADSPFDYANRAEVIIVTDIKRGDLSALAGGYARLIEAAGGGVLGLFTAIRRLRAVHGRIADRLARAGLPLFAQHVDPIDTGTLVDIFRDDTAASLLGTDALRDGVDVPGASLRCVVMEGVPWPKPSILHRARRAAANRASQGGGGQGNEAANRAGNKVGNPADMIGYGDTGSLGGKSGGGSAYDDQIIRAKLAQAFGRLIRGKQDKGHFVVLSSAFPSRLLGAFPAGTPILRLTLEEALQRVATGVSSAPQESLMHNDSDAISPDAGEVSKENGEQSRV